MEIDFISQPQLKEPIMIAAWPGMGYLAKISADYLRRRLEADKFIEIRYHQNIVIYKNSLAELPSIRYHHMRR
jgi:proteasome assembly chaperone (PAC2) family protein